MSSVTMTNKNFKEPRGWNRFYITYNPHFKEYHAIRELSGCAAFSNNDRRKVVEWIAAHGQPMEQDLFSSLN